MIRVLLVIEEISQLNTMKVLLSKLGLVVETAAVDLGLKDHLLSFRPEVVLTSGSGRKVNPLLVGQKAKDLSRDIKVFILVPHGAGGHRVALQGAFIDGAIEFSGDPTDLLGTLNPLLKTKSPVDLLEKYQKLSLNALEEGGVDIWVAGSRNPSSAEGSSPFSQQFATSRDSRERSQAYMDLTKNMKVDSQSQISKAKAKEAWKPVADEADEEKLKAIEEEKRRVAGALFRKK
jgi:hypothetical protein